MKIAIIKPIVYQSLHSEFPLFIHSHHLILAIQMIERALIDSSRFMDKISLREIPTLCESITVLEIITVLGIITVLCPTFVKLLLSWNGGISSHGVGFHR